MSLPAHHPTVERAIRPGEAAALGPGGGAQHLRWLLRRVADDDRAAFAELFHQVSGPVSSRLHRQLPDPPRVAGVVAGTFVEVWWLAGGHVEPDTDVMAWINEIVRRRVADSRSLGSPTADRAAPKSVEFTALWAHRVVLELAGLLRRRATP